MIHRTLKNGQVLVATATSNGLATKTVTLRGATNRESFKHDSGVGINGRSTRWATYYQERPVASQYKPKTDKGEPLHIIYGQGYAVKASVAANSYASQSLLNRRGV